MTPEKRAWAITEKYYHEYFRKLFGYVCRICPEMCREDVKGCLTDTFIDLCVSILRDNVDALHGKEFEDCFENDTQMVVCNWLTTAVKHRAFSFLKRHRKCIAVEDVSVLVDMTDHVTPDSLAELDETNSFLSEARNSLSEKEQAVICGIYDENRKLREVAEDLNIPQGTVSTVHRRSLRKLNDNLKGRIGEDPHPRPDDTQQGDDHESK